MHGFFSWWRSSWTTASVALAVAGALGCGDDDAAGPRPCDADTGCPEGERCIASLCAPAHEPPTLEPEPAAGRLRAFAVGLHPVPSDFETQDTFCDAIGARMEADVSPNLASDRPNLIVFPENTGLMVPVVGERGARARDAETITGAYLTVSSAYGDAGSYYLERFGTLAPGRVVTLSVTDTLWRSLACFGELARDQAAWVAVTYNVADAERTTDPELVRILVDEGATDRSYAWVATSDEVLNQTLLYGPDGELAHRWAKEYLVPDEESGLDLTYGALGNLEPFAAPWGPTASVISKDAWMPDVLDRLALDGARLMLQPEAFSGWGIPHGEDGAWAPDVVKESGWSHVMRYPEHRANVLPCLSGNVFDMVFDCQSAVIVDAALTDETGAFIGQDPAVGFVDVAPWVVEDDGTGSLEERRARLIETGERLLRGSGDPLENAYVAGTAYADLDLSGPWPEPSTTGTLVEPAGQGQRRPDLTVLSDGTVLLVHEHLDPGAQLRIARLSPEGAVLEAPYVPVDHTGPVRAPRLAAGPGDAVHLVWQERLDGRWVVRHARSSDGGRHFPDPVTLSGDAGGWVPDVAVDRDTGIAHVVWIDLRSGAGRVWYARIDGGAPPEARPLEEPPPGRYDTRHNRWSPSVSARGGTVAIAWTDFRSFAWDIRGVLSVDGGESFGEVLRLDDADPPHEVIHSDPRSLLLDADTWLVAWTDLRVRRPDYDVRVRRFATADPEGAGASVRLAGGDEGRPQWEPTIAASGRRVAVVWQDFRTDRNELYLAVSDDGGESWAAAERLSGGATHRWHPTAAVLPDDGLLVAAELGAGDRRRLEITRVAP